MDGSLDTRSTWSSQFGCDHIPARVAGSDPLLIHVEEAVTTDSVTSEHLGAGRRPWRSSGTVEAVVEADPQRVYDLVSDVTRIGERSPECHAAAWESGEPGVVGAVFRGRNRWGVSARWSRRCVVTEAEPGRRFTFRTIPEPWDLSRRDSTTWSYDIAPADEGSRVTHHYEITVPPLRPFRLLFGALLPHHRDMRPHMQHNLEVLARQLGDTDPAAGRADRG